jgi:hypothetical protein
MMKNLYRLCLYRLEVPDSICGRSGGFFYIIISRTALGNPFFLNKSEGGRNVNLTIYIQLEPVTFLKDPRILPQRTLYALMSCCFNIGSTIFFHKL